MKLDLLYDSVELQAVIDNSARPTTFLRDTFFPNVHKSPTGRFGWDILDGMGIRAPYIDPEIGNKTVEKGAYKTVFSETPTVAPSTVITYRDLERRLPGRRIGEAPNFAEAQRILTLTHVSDFDRMITRTEESQAAEQLFYGTVTVNDEGISDTIDFWTPLSPSGASPFTDVGFSDSTLYWDGVGADILGDLTAARRAATKTSGKHPNVAILGERAAGYLLTNQAILDRLDSRRVDAGHFAATFLGNGVTHLGYLRDVGLDLFTYDGVYEDAAGNEVDYVPATRVLVTTIDLGGIRAYGPVQMAAPDGITIRNDERNVGTYVQVAPRPGIVVEVKSAPLAVNSSPMAAQVLQVLPEP